MSTLDFDYDDYSEDEDFTTIKYPAVGSYAVVEITGAEFKQFDSGASQISIKGTFPEYPQTKFYSELWIPRNQGDEEKFMENRARFLGQLRKMGVSLTRGMPLEDVAAQMVGRFARSKVMEKEDYKDVNKKWIKPGYLGELTAEQKKTFRNPEPQSSQRGSGAPAVSSASNSSNNTGSKRRGFGRG